MDLNNPNPNLLDMMTSTDNNLPPPVIPTPSKQANETQFINEHNLSTTNCDISDEFDGLSFLDDDFLNDIINSDVSGEISNGNGRNNSPPVIPTPSMQVNESQIMPELDISTTNCDTNDDFDGLSLVDDDFSIPWDMFEDNDNINNDVPKEIGNDNVSYIADGTTRLEVSPRAFRDNNGPDFETGGTSTIRVPISDGVRLCNCCNVLQQLVHSDGYERNTLEIRGGIGFFCHAILEIRPFAGCKERRYQTLDLKDLTMEEVKSFIDHYCLERVTKNLLLVQDTIYQNANTIHNQSQTLTINPPSDEVPRVMPDQRLNVPPVSTTGLPKERRRRQTPLAAQRERTGKMTVKDICMHFHLPIEEAGKKMNVCPTVLKKICRKGGLKRWPCRKIQCLERKIELVRTAKNAAVGANADAEIDRLQKQIDKICNGK